MKFVAYIRCSEFVKIHWKLSLISALIIFFSLIFLAFYLKNTAMALTLVAIMPPSIYYFYTEWLNQPSLSIEIKEQPYTVAPMSAPSEFLRKVQELNTFSVPIEEVEQRNGKEIIKHGLKEIKSNVHDQWIVRPAVFYRFLVRNKGKATAKNTMVKFSLEGNKRSHEFYARWTDPENSERYDLLPGQDHDIFLAKVFLTSDFFPSSPLIKNSDSLPRSKYSKSGVQVSVLGNPDGLIRPLPEIQKDDFVPRVYIPREQRPEKKERSIAGGWEGYEIGSGPYFSENKIYNVKAQVIADNYRSDWEDLNVLNFPNDFIEAAKENKNWQEQWNIQLGEIKKRLITLAQDYTHS